MEQNLGRKVSHRFIRFNLCKKPTLPPRANRPVKIQPKNKIRFNTELNPKVKEFPKCIKAKDVL